MVQEPTSKYWVLGLSCLISLVGISIFISNMSTSRDTWRDAHLQHWSTGKGQPRLYPYAKYFPGVVLGAFPVASSPSVYSLSVIEAPAPAEELRRSVRPPAEVCARRANGSLPIVLRRGVSVGACGDGFRVYFPDEHETRALGCHRVEEWAGYVCASVEERSFIKASCPLWNATLTCDLGPLEPCHPHKNDVGCTEGISPTVINGTCNHKCASGLLFDPREPYVPVCTQPGTVLSPPPCYRQCLDNPGEGGGEGSFSIVCNSAPVTENDMCKVVPELWTQTCTKTETSCNSDNSKIKCKESTCPADPVGRGVSNAVPLGTHVAPRCQSGFAPTTDLIHCGTDGWSHENICRPTRPPRFKIFKTSCVAGRRSVVRQVLDVGHPPMKTGGVSSSKTVACSAVCCPNGGIYESVEIPGLRECRCTLSRFGFEFDPESPRKCCTAPEGWGSEETPQWRTSHTFALGAVETPCKKTPCSLDECVNNPGGCLAFGAGSLFLRPDAPNAQPDLPLVYDVSNVVVIEYIFA